MDVEYSNREIDRMFKEIQDTLGRIETQTMRTNGRVTKLEWRDKFNKGALAVISTVVIPMGVYIFTKVL